MSFENINHLLFENDEDFALHTKEISETAPFRAEPEMAGNQHSQVCDRGKGSMSLVNDDGSHQGSLLRRKKILQKVSGVAPNRTSVHKHDGHSSHNQRRIPDGAEYERQEDEEVSCHSPILVENNQEGYNIHMRRTDEQDSQKAISSSNDPYTSDNNVGCDDQPLQSGVDFESILKKQEKILKERNYLTLAKGPNIYGRNRGLKRKKSTQAGELDSSPILSIEQKWMAMLEMTLNKDEDFFNNDEEILEKTEKKTGRSTCFYAGLHVSEENCNDLADIYRLKYEAKKLINWRGWSSFAILRSAAGQLMRWAVVSKVLDKKNGWKKNALFSLYRSDGFIRCFINYFILNCAPSTVYSKCYSLLVIGRVARIRLQEDLAATEKVDGILVFLNTTYNAAKSKARELYRMKQKAEERVSSQDIVTEEDISRGVKLATARLEDVKASLVSSVRTHGLEKAVTIFSQNQALIDKWALNFLGLLTLTGGWAASSSVCQSTMSCRKRLESAIPN